MKVLGYILLGIVLLLVLLLVAVRLPAVQTYIAQQATSILAEKTGGKVSINQVRINFVDEVQLKGLYVEDLTQDTLLYAQLLEVDISLFALISQEVNIDGVLLENAVGKLRQDSAGQFNFQFLIDAFTTDAPKDTTPSSWTVSADNLELNNVSFLLDIPGTRVQTQVQSLLVDVDNLDLEKQTIGIDEVSLIGSRTVLQLTQSVEDTTALRDTIPENQPIAYPLPDIGWTLYVNDFNVEDTDVDYNLGEAIPKAGEMDYNHLHLAVNQLSLSDYRWEGKMMTVNLDELIATEQNSNYSIAHLEGQLTMDTTQIVIDKLRLKTAGSQLSLSAKVDYETFNELLTLDKSVAATINLNNTYVAMADLRTFVPGFEEIDIINPKLNDTIFLDGQINGGIGDIKKSTLSARIGKGTRVKLDFSTKGLPDYEQATFDISIRELSTSYNDFHRIAPGIALPEGLAILGRINVTGDITGSLANLTANNLNLQTASTTTLVGDAKVKGLPYIDTTYFALNLKEFTTSVEDMAAIATIDLPAEVERLEVASYTGSFEGTIYTPNLKGKLTTALGSLQIDAQASFDTSYSFATYKGDLQLQEFDLGTMLNNEDLGKLSLSIKTEGAGIDPETIAASVEARVDAFTFMEYAYQNVTVNGRLDTMQFEGKINIDDPNVQFMFDGLVSMRDSVSDFQFTADLDTLNLKALNLSTNALGISAHIESDIYTGKGGPSDLNGKAKIENLIVSDAGSTYRLDSLVVQAYDSSGGQKVLSLSSPIINGMIAGNYSLTELPRQLEHYVLNYLNDGKPATADSSFQLVNQEVSLIITIGNPQPLTKVFLPALSLDTAYIKGRFSNVEDILELEANIPWVSYDSILVGAINLNLSGKEKTLSAKLNIDSVQVSEDMTFPNISLDADATADKLSYRLIMQEDTGYVNLDLAGTLTQDSSTYVVSLSPEMILNNKAWAINPDNEIAILSEYFSVNNLVLKQGTQQVSIKSKAGAYKHPLSVNFNSFKISEISNLVQYEGINLKGTINGSLTLNDIRTNLDFTSDLELLNIRVNDSLVGNLMVDAVSTGSLIELNVELSGTENDLEIRGSIDTETKYLDVNTRIQKLKLSLLDPFLKNYIRTSQGYLGVKATIKGDIAAPAVNGTISFHSIGTRVIPAGERYRIKDNTVKITDKTIVLNQFQLLDKSKNLLTIDGQINHNLFQDLTFDLKVNTDMFSMMNTSRENNETLYGKIVLGVKATVKGPLELPQVEANVITRSGTEVYVEPLSFESGMSDRDYIIFYNPNADTNEEIDTIALPKKEYIVETGGIDLQLNFELTADAKIQIIIDPLSGDSLTTYGSAQLTVNIPPSGQPEILGTYTIEKGQYRLSYQNLLRKQFEIQKGSSIVFTGDPLNARLDITAVYKTMTTTYELIASEVTGIENDDSDASKKPQEVHVLLSVDGDLGNPEISFDIAIPSGSITSTVERKLAQIRQDPSELNKQAFGLLVLNSFISEESGGDSNLGTTGSNLALRSASRLITQQLNKLTSKARGVNINFNLDSYQSKFETETGGQTVTEVGVELSKTFLNDRLEISAGSDVNLQSDAAQQGESNFTQVAGDFILEYRITENGKYRLKVFNTTDYDVLNQANINRTGVGITYKESFTKLLGKNKQQSKDMKGDKKEDAPVEENNTPSPAKQEDNEGE